MEKAGEGVNLYVFDTGIRITHNALNTHSTVTRFNEGRYNQQDPNADTQHGTAVAGAAKEGALFLNIIDVKILGLTFYT